MAEPEPTALTHPAGRVRLERLDGGRTRLRVEMNDPRAFVARRTWETSYPLALIERTRCTRCNACIAEMDRAGVRCVL